MKAFLKPLGRTVRTNWIDGETRCVVTGPVNANGKSNGNRRGNPSETVRTSRQDELDHWEDTLGGDCVNSNRKSHRNRCEGLSEPVRKNRQDELDRWKGTL